MSMNKELNERGFILPVILSGLVIMTALAVAALITSGDEQRSSQAVHESGVVFYAAEAGIHEIWGNWDSTKDSLVNLLNPADTLDLGWFDLAGGVKYHGMVIRTDDGSGEPSYILMVESRGAGVRGRRRLLSVALTGGAGGGGGPYELGKCCDAAITANGEVDIHHSTVISGEDSIPPGWDPTRCDDYPPEDVPGIIAKDTTLVNVDEEAYWGGDPPLVQDDSLANADYYSFGDVGYDSLLNLATTHLERSESQSTGGIKYGGDPAPAGCRVHPVTSGSSDGCYYGPRYNFDGSCDTGHPLNFGAPSGPCKDHFPIVRITGNWAFNGMGDPNGYAQGIFVLDTFPSGRGSVFDMEKYDDVGVGQTVVGLLVGKGCIEWEEHAYFYGAVFVDGINTPDCNTDENIQMHKLTAVQYSQCAVQKAIELSGLGDLADPREGGLAFIKSRAMREILR